MAMRSLLAVPLVVLTMACADPVVEVETRTGVDTGVDESGDGESDAENSDAENNDVVVSSTSPSHAATSAITGNADSAGDGPQVGIDHWHNAYLIHDCGTDVPPATAVENPDGIHTHGKGLIHIHPFTPAVAGSNATFGKFAEALGSQLDDQSYTPGPFEDLAILSESDGCGGQIATLQLAYWEDAASSDPPVVITQNIAGHRFIGEGSAYTLALLPPGVEIPKPPLDRLELLAELT